MGMKAIDCAMRACPREVTHIGEKGYIYCSLHAKDRRRFVGERCRKMRVWELNLLRADKPLPSYQPIRKPAEVQP